MVSVPQEPEVALAQRLAANERPVRAKALKTLRKYISLRSKTAGGGFGRDDLLKIWKGLFYSLWMQDKPDLQEELSDRVSGLIHCFHTFDSQLLYFETFVFTVKREWNGIDRLRMDKFFQLVRFTFRQVFEVLRRREWESSLVDKFLAVFTAELLQSAQRVPDGLMLHILELYMTELARIGSAELTADQNLIFIQPFCKTISETKDRSVLSFICNKVFSTIIDLASHAVEQLMKELSDGEDSGAAEDEDEGEEEEEVVRRTLKKAKKVNGLTDMENGDEDSFYELMEMDKEDPVDSDDDDVGPVLQFDYGAIADCLFELGSRPITPNFNRTKIYKLVKTLRDLSEGIFPQDDDTAAKRKGQSSKKNKKKGKKQADNKSAARKRKACEDEQKLIEPDQDEEQSLENVKKKKKNGEAETEQSAETPQDGLETSEEAEAVMVNTETLSQSQDDEGLHNEQETNGKKKKKGKKLSSGTAGQDAPAHRLANTEDELRRCLDPEMLEEEDSNLLKTTAPPSGRKKCGKKSKKNNEEEPRPECRDQTITDVQQENNISASSLVKKKKQKKKSSTDDEVINFRCDNSDDQLSATNATSANIERELESGAVSPKKKKKNKKQKVKELAAHVSEPEVATDNKPTGNTGPDHTAEEKEALCKAEGQEEAEPAGTLLKPIRKKKKQKKQKKAMLKPMEDMNEDTEISECTEEPVLSGKQKQKAKAVVEEEESTPLRKNKKKRKIQADEAETSQMNGQTVKEDLEISTSVKSKKKLKKASSQSGFASFKNPKAAPTPLLCRVKPKVRSRKGSSILMTFLKADAKKVTFGLKNNKTTEFKTTDQSLLVSPVGSSRVAFDPEKKPVSSVLKPSSTSPFSRQNKATPMKRPTAADFF